MARLVWLALAGCAAKDPPAGGGDPTTTGDTDPPTSDTIDTVDTVDTTTTHTGDTAVEPICVTTSVPGTGYTELVPLAAGGPIELVYGEQGGWHVEGAGYISGFGSSVSVATRLYDVELGVQLAGANLMDQPSYLALVDYDGCGGTFLGARAVIDDWIPPDEPITTWMCNITGRALRLEATVLPLVPDPAYPDEVTWAVEGVAVQDPEYQKLFCGG